MLDLPVVAGVRVVPVVLERSELVVEEAVGRVPGPRDCLVELVLVGLVTFDFVLEALVEPVA